MIAPRACPPHANRDENARGKPAVSMLGEPPPRGISNDGPGRYTGSREPDPPPSRENFSQWLEAIVLQASLVDPRSLTVAGAAQAFHLFPV
jgi:hypothetical protein